MAALQVLGPPALDAPAPATLAANTPPQADAPSTTPASRSIAAAIQERAAPASGYSPPAPPAPDAAQLKGIDTPVADTHEPAPPAVAVLPTPALPMVPEAPPAAAQPFPASVAASAPAPHPQMVDLPGGTFRMGSLDDPSERPPHAVTLPPFRIAAHAVTVADWQLCVQQKGCALKPEGRPDDPVANASWNDTSQYVAWLSATAQVPYRLPTEAEWEYAARAGSQTRYAWGNEMLPGKANCRGCGPSMVQGRPAVGDYPPNLFGLYAMGGGVAEWTADCWHRDYTGAPRDGSTPWDAPDCRERVLRGGSWMGKPSELRPASRESYDAAVRYPTHGFRVAQSVPQSK